MLILVYLTMSYAWLDQINMTTWTLYVLGVLGSIFQTFNLITSATMDQLVKVKAVKAQGSGFNCQPLHVLKFWYFSLKLIRPFDLMIYSD